MWIVAVAWIYVVGLMALTEPNVVAGIMTFLGYCVLPLSILYYLSGSKRRRLRNQARDEREAQARRRAAADHPDHPDHIGIDTPGHQASRDQV
jgi:hypothetical protein